MKMPWHNKTGLARLATIFVVLLLVSLGLCGANFALFTRFGAIGGGGPVPDKVLFATNTLMTTGFLELGGILIGVGGLFTVLLAGIFQSLTKPKDMGSDKDQ
jgi:hypothetical protein